MFGIVVKKSVKINVFTNIVLQSIGNKKYKMWYIVDVFNLDN